ncbi:hypothetical protein [Marinobacter alexandrii]|uniref:hypothetical protein n=1 Tax=Marinobacter alexandrii TaxID=2570351 RepID=UPI001107F6E6|nr:hypothetical protein [Marinobacter alexandrii]
MTDYTEVQNYLELAKDSSDSWIKDRALGRASEEITALRQQLSDAKDGERMLWGFLEDKRQELEQVEIRAFALNECLAEMVNEMDSGDEPGAGLPWHTRAKQALSSIGRAIILRKQAEAVDSVADRTVRPITVSELRRVADLLREQAGELENPEGE